MTIARLKADFAQLREDPPGHRFQNHHARKRREEKARSDSHAAWTHAALVGSGLVLIIGGALLSLVPGVPGILFAIPGIALLVARSQRLARILDRTEIAARRAVKKLCRD